MSTEVTKPASGPRKGVSGTGNLGDVLTTGQASKICNVAPQTVSKWLDTGLLNGYRIPGGKHRRIPLAHLVAFMREHGFPLDGLPADHRSANGRAYGANRDLRPNDD